MHSTNFYSPEHVVCDRVEVIDVASDFRISPAHKYSSPSCVRTRARFRNLTAEHNSVRIPSSATMSHHTEISEAQRSFGGAGRYVLELQDTFRISSQHGRDTRDLVQFIG